jgi:hypothetical protein
VWAEVKQHFRPEFLNRIDETVVFHALDQKHIESIAKIQLKLLEARLEKLEMKLEVSPEALAELAKVGFDPVFGARPLKRAIQQRIENPVSKLILQGKFGPKDVIPVDVEDGEFSFERVVHVTPTGLCCASCAPCAASAVPEPSGTISRSRFGQGPRISASCSGLELRAQRVRRQFAHHQHAQPAVGQQHARELGPRLAVGVDVGGVHPHQGAVGQRHFDELQHGQRHAMALAAHGQPLHLAGAALARLPSRRSEALVPTSCRR